MLKLQFQGAEPGTVFECVFDPADSSKEWVWERLSSRRFGSICLYVFPCKACNRFRSTWDTD